MESGKTTLPYVNNNNNSFNNKNDNVVVINKRTTTFKRSVRFYIRSVIVMLIIFALLAAIAAINYHFLGLLWMVYTLIQIIIFTLFVYLIITKKYKWFYVALVTAPRDIK